MSLRNTQNTFRAVFALQHDISRNIYKYKSRNKDMQEEFEDTKGVIRSRKSKKDRQHYGQKKKDKGTNKDL